MIFTRIASVASVVVLTACAAQTENQPPKKETIEQKVTMSLAGSEWGTETESQFIQFGADGKVLGNGGCNRFSGSFAQSENVLSFGPLMSTKMACKNMRAEQHFFDILSKTKRADITHTTLILKNEKGDVLGSLARRGWD